MENWKIATIAALLLSLLGFGIRQQILEQNPPKPPVAPPAPSPYAGTTLPPWNFKVWNGTPVSPASLQGKPALVEIFRTECSHCQEAAPFMVALQNRYKPRGLQIVAIQSPGDLTTPTNPENSWGDVSAWLKNKKINYPVAFDQNSKYFQGTFKNQVLGGDNKKLFYPMVILTDKNGKIDFSQTGHDINKAIMLAVELEKRFPTSADLEKSANDLTQWLKQNLPELPLDAAMEKSLRDDLAERLKLGP